MHPSALIAFIACAGQLGVALLALLRPGRSPLAMPLALLAADLFAWNFALAAADLSQSPIWPWLDATATPLTAPLGLDFVLVFVGQRRSLRRLRRAAYACFGLLSSIVAASALFPALREVTGPQARAWPLMLLAGTASVCAVGGWLLVRHLREATSPDEAARTRLLLLALPIGAALGSTEFLINPLSPLGIAIPHLGSVGVLLCAVVMAIVALRLRLFGHELSTSVVVHATGLTIAGVAAYAVLFQLLGAHRALLVGATTLLTISLITVARRAAADAARRRERLSQLAALGRISAQMAHDLKNPLAALKGAAQFLIEERARGRSIDGHTRFLDLMLTQIGRIERSIDEYQGALRIDPTRAPVSVATLVRDTLALQPFAASSNIAVRADLAGDLPLLHADQDLLSRVLENLMRNAFEAMPGGGVVTVRAERSEAPDGVAITVEDTGEGMDARAREQAFDEFFTTKAMGAGLGLPFARRVVEAHGGDIELHPRPGGGTAVRIRFPAA